MFVYFLLPGMPDMNTFLVTLRVFYKQSNFSVKPLVAKGNP